MKGEMMVTIVMKHPSILEVQTSSKNYIARKNARKK